MFNRKRISRRIPALVLTATSLTALGAGSAYAAPDGPAHSAGVVSPSVVPSGCTTSWNIYFPSRDRYGAIVNSKAVHLTGAFDWSSSGASVGVDHMAGSSADGHTWIIDAERFQGGVSGGPYRGPGGTMSASYGVNWIPNPIPWIKEGTPQAQLYLHAYDQARTSVGVTAIVYTCP